jgi:hypothetical protein
MKTHKTGINPSAITQFDCGGEDATGFLGISSRRFRQAVCIIEREIVGMFLEENSSGFV